MKIKEKKPQPLGITIPSRKQAERQAKKKWEKSQLVLALQDMLLSMPQETCEQVKTWITLLKEYNKLSGFHQASVATTTNQVLVIPKEKSTGSWATSATKQQRKLAAATAKVEADTGQ